MSDLDSDAEIADAPPPGPAAGANTQSIPDIDENACPNRPTNRNPTLPFHTLHTDLFEPLLANRTGKRVGGRGFKAMKPHEARRLVIERYVARWRKEVGADVFPVFRLSEFFISIFLPSSLFLALFLFFFFFPGMVKASLVWRILWV